jgi:hypothetical protein
MSKTSITSDPRLIYLLLILVIAIPILTHAVLPVPVTETTQAVYNFIEGLPPNSLVVVSFDYSTSTVPELQPQATIVTQHLFLRPLKLLFVAQWTDGPALTDAVLGAINKENKTYGRDYATLGYIPNTATLIGMTANIQSFFPLDTRGNPTDSLPIIKQFPAARQAALVITFVAGEPGLSYYLQYWQARYNIPVAAGSVASLAPGFEPFYNSRQIVGILISIRGAAEYELLEHAEYSQIPIGLSGASSAMVAQSSSHMLIVAMVVVGNAAYFLNRRARKAS